MRADKYLNDLALVKRKTKLGIPHHVMGSHREPTILDVNKILSSNDLVHILEDDYHNDQMKIGPNAIEEAELVNMDQYVKSIASIIYEEYYEPCIRCAVSV